MRRSFNYVTFQRRETWTVDFRLSRRTSSWLALTVFHFFFFCSGVTDAAVERNGGEGDCGVGQRFLV